MDAHVGFESWLERDVAMALDFDPRSGVLFSAVLTVGTSEGRRPGLDDAIGFPTEGPVALSFGRKPFKPSFRVPVWWLRSVAVRTEDKTACLLFRPDTFFRPRVTDVPVGSAGLALCAWSSSV